MKPSTKHEIIRRLEALVHERGTGRADFWDWELIAWVPENGGSRLTKGIWKVLRDLLVEITDDESSTFTVFHNAHGQYTLMHPDHVRTFAQQVNEAE